MGNPEIIDLDVMETKSGDAYHPSEMHISGGPNASLKHQRLQKSWKNTPETTIS